MWYGALLWNNTFDFLLFLDYFLDQFHFFFLFLRFNLFLVSFLLLDGLVLLVAQVGSFSLHGHLLFFELVCLLSELFGNLRCFVRLGMLLFRL